MILGLFDYQYSPRKCSTKLFMKLSTCCKDVLILIFILFPFLNNYSGP